MLQEGPPLQQTAQAAPPSPGLQLAQTLTQVHFSLTAAISYELQLPFSPSVMTLSAGAPLGTPECALDHTLPAQPCPISWHVTHTDAYSLNVVAGAGRCR